MLQSDQHFEISQAVSKKNSTQRVINGISVSSDSGKGVSGLKKGDNTNVGSNNYRVGGYDDDNNSYDSDLDAVTRAIYILGPSKNMMKLPVTMVKSVLFCKLV